MKTRHSAVLRYGFADQIHRHIIAARLMGENAEKMQGVGVTRIRQENLPVKPLRFAEMSGLVFLQGEREQLLNTRQCHYFIERRY